MNFDNAVKFFDLCRVSLEIYYYVVAFALVSDFVGKMTFAPFINFVNGTTDSGDGVLYQFDSSFDEPQGRISPFREPSFCSLRR